MDAIFAEQAVCGAILIDAGCLSPVRKCVSTQDFKTSWGSTIFAAACRLADTGSKVDPVLIQSAAQSAGAALSADFLVQLMEITPSAANAEEYAKQVHQAAMLRRVQELAETIQAQCEEGGISPEMVVSYALRTLQSIDAGTGSALVSNFDLMGQMLEHRGRLQEGKYQATVSTGYTDLDVILGGGMVREGLYILAARPGVGKTTFAMKIAESVAQDGAVLFVSLEMSNLQLGARQIADKAGLPVAKILNQPQVTDAEFERISKAAAELAERTLFFNQRPNATIADISLMAHTVSNLRLLVVDYLGLIAGEGKENSLYQKTTETSNALKRLARSLGVPVLCLAQLNRASEQRTDKRPTLADLRDSGAIEQDADGVLLLHRPAIYFPEEQKPKPWEAQALDVIVAKNRHGRTDTARFDFYGNSGRIREA